MSQSDTPSVLRKKKCEKDIKNTTLNFTTLEGLGIPGIKWAPQYRLDYSQFDRRQAYSTLPKQLKGKFKCLEELQTEYSKLESDFYKEALALECKYDAISASLYDMRKSIISKTAEPFRDAIIDKQSPTDTYAAIVDADDIAGIPEFWEVALLNAEMLADRIKEYDMPILNHLIDIKSSCFANDERMGFTLEFYFEKNNFFTNEVLVKEYEMKCFPLDDNPFAVGGPEIYKCKGCQIQWKRGKNITVTTTRKKHKLTTLCYIICKKVRKESFFNFFNPPYALVDDNGQVDQKVQVQLMEDFVIGKFIREKFIPNAVLYFLGEADRIRPSKDYNVDENLWEAEKYFTSKYEELIVNEEESEKTSLFEEDVIDEDIFWETSESSVEANDEDPVKKDKRKVVASAERVTKDVGKDKTGVNQKIIRVLVDMDTVKRIDSGASEDNESIDSDDSCAEEIVKDEIKLPLQVETEIFQKEETEVVDVVDSELRENGTKLIEENPEKEIQEEKADEVKSIDAAAFEKVETKSTENIDDKILVEQKNKVLEEDVSANQ